jgi:acyl-CoA synthetase (AMP-forming)/AMP-acid ligase II
MHSTGLTTAIATLCAGGTVVTLTAAGFDADECLDAIDRHAVTTLSIVGDAFGRPLLAALDRADHPRSLHSLTSISSAGVMWSAESKQGLLRHFPHATLRDALGSSEGSGLASMETRVGGQATTARFVLGNGVKVFTDDWREVEPGSGELGRIAKSGYLPIGYYNDDAKTAETFPVIGGVRYSVPGDWCSVEADGTITLIGRGSTCINTGGEKVFPEEVETALAAQPEVADALVTGVPDERWGQAVAALVRLEPGHHLDPDELRERLRSTLAGYKLPRVIRFVDEVPRAPSGKADYAEVRRRFES